MKSTAQEDESEKKNEIEMQIVQSQTQTAALTSSREFLQSFSVNQETMRRILCKLRRKETSRQTSSYDGD